MRFSDREHPNAECAVWTGLPSPYDEFAMEHLPVWYVFEILSDNWASNSSFGSTGQRPDDNLLVVGADGTDLQSLRAAVRWEGWVAIAAESADAARDRWQIARDQSVVRTDPSGMGKEILKEYADPPAEDWDEFARQIYDGFPFDVSETQSA